MQFQSTFSETDLLSLLDLINQCSQACSELADIDGVFAKFQSLVPFVGALVVLNQRADEKYEGPNLVYHFRWHRAWLDWYASRDLWRDDPTIGAARGAGYPVFWRIASEASAGPYRHAAALLEQSGLAQGLAVSRSETYGNSSSCFIALAFASATEPDEKHRLFLHYASTHIQQIFLRKGELSLARHNAPILTKRELETLLWILQGKNTSDISMILAISERTVKFHIANVFGKLNVVNRPQAIAKAISLGLLMP